MRGPTRRSAAAWPGTTAFPRNSWPLPPPLCCRLGDLETLEHVFAGLSLPRTRRRGIERKAARSRLGKCASPPARMAERRCPPRKAIRTSVRCSNCNSCPGVTFPATIAPGLNRNCSLSPLLDWKPWLWPLSEFELRLETALELCPAARTETVTASGRTVTAPETGAMRGGGGVMSSCARRCCSSWPRCRTAAMPPAPVPPAPVSPLFLGFFVIKTCRIMPCPG